uniref:Phage protein n=1 Tax=Pseudomonas phage vB_PaeM_HTN3 TaxID=3236644 RepID=A0AB39AHC3_9VIRU
MNPLLPIVHIVLKDGEVLGVFDCDKSAKWYSNVKDAVVDSWVVESPNSSRSRLVRKECYEVGDHVMYRDEHGEGHGRILAVEPRGESARDEKELYRLYQINSDDPSVDIWMLDADIIGIYPDEKRFTSEEQME